MKRVLAISLLTGIAFAQDYCSVLINTKAGGHSEKLLRVKDLASNPLISEQVGRLTSGEPLHFTLSRVGSGYRAVLSTPVKLQYPPVAPTFSLSAMSVARAERPGNLILLIDHQQSTDQEVSRAKVTCFAKGQSD